MTAAVREVELSRAFPAGPLRAKEKAEEGAGSRRGRRCRPDWSIVGWGAGEEWGWRVTGSVLEGLEAWRRHSQFSIRRQGRWFSSRTSVLARPRWAGPGRKTGSGMGCGPGLHWELGPPQGSWNLGHVRAGAVLGAELGHLTCVEGRSDTGEARSLLV